MPAFDKAEYRARVAAVSAAMEVSGIETLVILHERHLCYLTGYEGRSDYVPQVGILRLGDSDVTLVLREMDIHCAYPTVYLDPDKVDFYPEHYIGTTQRTPWEVIGKKILEKAGPGRIGAELSASSFSHADFVALSTQLGGRELIDASGVVKGVTIRKSPAEIDYMRKAAAIVDNALGNGIATVAEGVRQCDVAARIQHDLAAGLPEFGGDASKFVTMPTGPGVAQAPHLKWTDAPFRQGDQTNFEVGAYVHRYCCALSRTSIVGPPSDRLRFVHEAVTSSWEAAFEAVRPGARCSDVHRAFKAKLAPTGIRKEARIGYSIGIDWNDLCFSLQADDETVLEPGYTMHIIIGIWEREDAYVFSESVLVGDTKGESLSRMPRDLFVR